MNGCIVALIPSNVMHRKYIYLLITICWLVVIWYVSSTPSYSLPNTGDVGSTIAHFVEYFILTFLVAKTLDAHEIPFHHHIIVPTFFLMIVAAGLDEFHQYFIPGRTPSWFDFSFDILGVIIGFSLYSILFHGKNYFHFTLTK